MMTVPGALVSSNLRSELRALQLATRPPIDDLFLMAHQPMVASGRTLGWWNVIRWVSFFGAPNGGHLVNVKLPSLRAIEVGTPGTVVWGAGWQGDGTTTYYDTRRTPTQLGMTANGVDAFLTSIVWVQTDLPGATSCCGATSPYTTGALRPRNGAVMGCWPAGVSQLTIPVSTGVGMCGCVANGGQAITMLKQAQQTTYPAPMPGVGTTTFRYGKSGAAAGFDPNQLAYGFAGPGISLDWASDMYRQMYNALTALGTWVPEPTFETVGPNDALVRDCLTLTPGAYQGRPYRVAQSPLHDGQEGYAKYSRTVVNLAYSSTPYAMTDADLGKELWCATSPAGPRTVNLPPATALNKYRRAIIRKADYTNDVLMTGGSTQTINRQFDVMIWVSTGTGWQSNNNWVPQRRIAGLSVPWDGSNNYTQTVANMAGGIIHPHPGNINRTVTLLPVSTAGIGTFAVRKMDSGTGTVTVTDGTTVYGVLHNKLDYIALSNNSGSWVVTTDFVDFGDQPLDRTTFDYYATTYDLANNIQMAAPNPSGTVHLLDPATIPNLSVQCVRNENGTFPTIVDAPGQGVLATMTGIYEWRVFQTQAGVWVDITTGNYPLDLGYVFPMSVCAARPWGTSLNPRQTKIKFSDFVWMPRALGPSPGVITAWAKKGNDTMGIIQLTSGPNAGNQCRTEFDTYELAMGELWTKMAWSLGYLMRNDPTLKWFDDTYRAAGWGVLDIADHMGYDTSGWEPYLADPTSLYTDVNINTGPVAHRAYFNANSASIFTQPAVSGQFYVTRNVIILGQGRLSDIINQPLYGVMWDCEAGDDRGPELFERTVRQGVRLAHAKGWKVFASGHPPSGSGVHSGWTKENANRILTSNFSLNDGMDERMDGWVIATNNSATSVAAMMADIQAQENFFRGPNDDLPIPYNRLITELRMGGNGQEIAADKVDALIAHRDANGMTECLWTPVYGAFGGFMSRPAAQRTAQYYRLPVVVPPS